MCGWLVCTPARGATEGAQGLPEVQWWDPPPKCRQGTEVLPGPDLQVPLTPGRGHSASYSGLVLLAVPQAGGWAGAEGRLAWLPVPLVMHILVPCPAHGLWCQDCTLTTNSSHCTPKQCQPSDTVCASVRITDPSSSESGPGPGWGAVGGVI